MGWLLAFFGVCMYVVFGYQENGSEFSLPVDVLWGKVVEVSVCVVFGWQETERKGEKINWGFILFFQKIKFGFLFYFLF